MDKKQQMSAKKRAFFARLRDRVPFDKKSGKLFNPHCKPGQIVSRIILHFSKETEVVFDFFNGGQVLKTALKMDQDCFVFCSTQDESDSIFAYASNVYCIVEGQIFDDDGGQASSGGHITTGAIDLNDNEDDDDWEPNLIAAEDGGDPLGLSIGEIHRSVRTESIGTGSPLGVLPRVVPGAGIHQTHSLQFNQGSQGSRRSIPTPQNNTP
ncbi:unnamed protein product [Calypogeia fissa]